jgi:hypothetical protein
METILIFAGGNPPVGGLEDELPEPDLVVAADSGYDHAVAAGFRVDVLVGDLDSIEAELIPSHVIVERFPEDKDATDLELALSRVAVESPERIVVVGGGGGRVDHELAVASLLCAEMSVLPEPSDPSETSSPASGLPLASTTVTVISEVSTSLASTPLVGLAEAVESDALMCEGSPTKPTVGC